MSQQIRRTDYAPPTQPGCPVESASPNSTNEIDHNKQLNHDPKTSGATKEAAQSKALEHGMEGRAQEARLRNMNPTVMVNGQPVVTPPKEEPQRMYKMVDGKWELVQNENEKAPDLFSESEQSGTVQINSKEAFRKDGANCDDRKHTINQAEADLDI